MSRGDGYKGDSYPCFVPHLPPTLTLYSCGLSPWPTAPQQCAKPSNPPDGVASLYQGGHAMISQEHPTDAHGRLRFTEGSSRWTPACPMVSWFIARHSLVDGQGWPVTDNVGVPLASMARGSYVARTRDGESRSDGMGTRGEKRG